MRQLLKGMTLIVLLIIVQEGLRAQQDAQYTQFMYNKLPQNAAYTGAREVLSLRVPVSRSVEWWQERGIAGAPKTTSFSIHSPLKNEHFALGFLVL